MGYMGKLALSLGISSGTHTQVLSMRCYRYTESLVRVKLSLTLATSPRGETLESVAFSKLLGRIFEPKLTAVEIYPGYLSNDDTMMNELSCFSWPCTIRDLCGGV